MTKSILVPILAAGMAGPCAPSGPSEAPSAPGGRETEAGLQVKADPEPVSPSAPLTYTVSGVSVLTAHLPPGAADVRTSGAGWICSQASHDADDYQPADHTDADCSSARVAGTPLLTVQIKAPASAGSIRACVVSRGATRCITTTVAP